MMNTYMGKIWISEPSTSANGDDEYTFFQRKEEISITNACDAREAELCLLHAGFNYLVLNKNENRVSVLII